ncbi:hypothetical protein HK102_010761, partial [Quaeritorhiza haematococci]
MANTPSTTLAADAVLPEHAPDTNNVITTTSSDPPPKPSLFRRNTVAGGKSSASPLPNRLVKKRPSAILRKMHSNVELKVLAADSQNSDDRDEMTANPSPDKLATRLRSVMGSVRVKNNSTNNSSGRGETMSILHPSEMRALGMEKLPLPPSLAFDKIAPILSDDYSEPAVTAPAAAPASTPDDAKRPPNTPVVAVAAASAALRRSASGKKTRHSLSSLASSGSSSDSTKVNSSRVSTTSPSGLHSVRSS